MKKIFAVAMVIIAMLGVSTIVAEGATKADVKAAKQQAKQLKKDGWIPEGTTTIENAFVKIEDLKSNGTKILSGTSYGVAKPNVAKTKARNNAINEFAEYGKSIIRGRLNTAINDIDENETDNLVAGYERLVTRELSGEITVPEFVIYRERGGKFDYQCFYAINEKVLQNIQKKALEQALENADLSAKYGDKISDFVAGGFNE